MRLIAFDTETTGASPASGDRCVDIGLVEIVDGNITGHVYQTYLNPETPVKRQSFHVHGLSDSFLADKPRFKDVAKEILEFVDGDPLVAHDARFDRDMLLYDFRYSGLEAPCLEFYDTLPFMRNMLPQQGLYKLDALAVTLLSKHEFRGRHSAVEDAEILARCICKIEEMKPGSMESWFSSQRSIDSYPKGWRAVADENLDFFDLLDQEHPQGLEI